MPAIIHGRRQAGSSHISKIPLAMVTQDPELHALNVARAAQQNAAPAMVILFGSRATGRYREGSDVDLLVVTDDDNPRGAEIRAYHAAREYMRANPPRLGTDVIGMTRAEFDRCRRANQHIAGQAARYGIVMNGETLAPPPPPPDRYPDHWPETRRRIESAEAWQRSLADMVDAEHWHQELVGFTAQQAVENALKGWLSAHNDSRTWGHELLELWVDIQNIEDWSDDTLSEAYRALPELFRYTHYVDPGHPQEAKDWLTDYAARYRYGGTAHRMSASERRELNEKVSAVVVVAVNRIHGLSGTNERDVYPDGIRPWDNPP